jgi:hypothetical protein
MCHTPFARGLAALDRTTASSAVGALGGVTMSIHKLSAALGYDYLTRQVAALDATAKGHVGLASYYTERGESPGWWIGSGMAGIDGLKSWRPGHGGADASPVRGGDASVGDAAVGAARRR